MKHLVKSVTFALALVSLAPLSAAPFPAPTPIKEVAPELQTARLQNVEQVMLHLNAGEQNTGMIPQVYAADALFIDPLFTEGVKGHEQLLRYHTSLNAMIETFTVDVQEVKQDGDTVTVYWKANATIKVNATMKIGPVAYDGLTRFGFAEGSNQINYHRDFYDSLPQYESIPILKQVLGTIKAQNKKALLPDAQ